MTYWLIEDNEEDGWYTYDIATESETWVKDVHQAIKFADKRSADIIIYLNALLTATAVEHEDVSSPDKDAS